MVRGDTAAMERIRLLLVDDEPTIRRGLRMRLELEPDVEVVGEAANGESAIDQIAALDPSVVLMDVEMPVMDGISATKAISEQSSAPAVVVLSIHDDKETIQRAEEAGASSFVPKADINDALITAIREAANSQKGDL
jgi:DNA-binding NarL/FixJ family response regulator